MAHHDQGLPRRAFHIQLGNLPRGPVVLSMCVVGAPGIFACALNAPFGNRRAPAVLVSPFVARCTERAHAFRGQVANSSKQVVVDGPSAHDAHHAAHTRGQPGRAYMRLASVTGRKERKTRKGEGDRMTSDRDTTGFPLSNRRMSS